MAQPIAIQDVRAVEKAQNGKGWNDDGTAYTVDTHATQGVAQPVGFTRCDDGRDAVVDGTPTMRCGSNYSAHLAVAQPVAIHENQRAEVTLNDTAGTVKCAGGKPGQGYPAVMVAPSLTASNDPSRSPQSSEVTQQVGAVYQAAMQVRRLTPTECERLQGFPDGWTNIPWRNKSESPDGPRYKALGNSMAVPCMAWIGNRINQHDVLH